MSCVVLVKLFIFLAVFLYILRWLQFGE